MERQKTELEKRNIVRLSNKEANLITKTCLQTALIDLLSVKNMNDITVTELSRKAGVSRTAFYSNYQTVNDVLAELINGHLVILNDFIWDAINNKEDMFFPIIKRMNENYDLYSLILKSDIDKTAFFQMKEYIKQQYPHIDGETYYTLIGLIGLLRGIILEWFANNCRESIEFISQICNAITRELREKILDSIELSGT